MKSRLIGWAIVGIGIMIGFAIPIPSFAAKSQTLQPFYLCHGQNSHGHTYETYLETATEDGQVQLRWTAPTGAVLLGVGFLEGDRLVVGLLLPGKTFGTAAYVVKGSTLTGKVMLAGLPGVVPEVCKAAERKERPAAPPEDHEHVDAGSTLKV